MKPCELENCEEKAVIKRGKDGRAVCKKCFIELFEQDVHDTIVKEKLFTRGDKVAIGASGGKDSTVLAYVVKISDIISF
ncbi:hypothetical protein WR25_24282 [Diploscapter pachys]|uniref:tRNA(Ile)-lysidine/2-thiocytidine synthase N-terminal domain-containing protein n=1 Tax=Diploscapter pachys TaxID=2018661 RepID=A0A2A2KDY9_9BILA|nr:hypothetical protein WR25_24282 [Diploscapter pachys]